MEKINKIFILGGAGFLGYHTIKEAVNRGYQVKTVDIVDLPENLKFKEEDQVEFIINNIFSKSDQEIIEILKDCDSFIYAGGVDERVVPQKPAGKFFYEKNVLPTQRFARLAKLAGVKSFVLFGSYTSEFAENDFELRKYNYHKEAYVQTRLMQEEIALYEGDGSMKVSILRLPYIFGYMEGKTPACKMYVEMIKDMEFMPVTNGGMSIVTATQVGQAAISALENGKDKKAYPLATGYISHKDFYQKIIEELGQEDITKLQVMSFDDLEEAYREDEKLTDSEGVEHGIRQMNMLRANCKELKMDSQTAYKDLRVKEEDLDQVIKETIHFANN